MNVEFREVVTVDAPVAQVARVLHDVARWPSWTPTMSRVGRRGSGPLVVGETVRVKQPRLPAGTWTVTAADDTGFRWTSSTPGVRSTGDHWATDAGGGRSTVTLGLRLDGPLAGVTSFFYSRLIRRYVRTEGESLRREVGKH
jgi:hypothetical protein